MTSIEDPTRQLCLRRCLRVWAVALVAALWWMHAFAAQVPNVVVVKITDTINVAVRERLTRALATARNDNAAAVLVELDTPGGYLDATRAIVQEILNSKMPVIVWVTPSGAHAASAGSMITMAAHYAAMAPSTSIGAATPVTAKGEDIGGAMKAKVENDTLSFVDGIAEKRGRNRDWARDSVTKASSVTATEAAKLGVIDAVADSRDAVWAGAAKKLNLSLETPQFTVLEPSLKENVLSLASNPNVAYGLMALGGLGVYLEFSHPGMVVPGAIGAVALALGAVTTNILPIRPGAIALFIVGLVLLAIELLTALPTYGVAGVAAAVSLFLSGVLWLDPEQTNLTISASIWLPSFFAIVGVMVFIGVQAGRALRGPAYPQGITGLVGQTAEVVSPGENEGRILVRGEIWRALWADGRPGAFEKGRKVVVVAQEGLVAKVSPQD